MQNWGAAEARNSFSDLFDAAAGGVPQCVRHRDGREVVMVSRAAWEASRPSLSDFLLGSSGRFDEEDVRALEGGIEAARGTGTVGASPRREKQTRGG